MGALMAAPRFWLASCSVGLGCCLKCRCCKRCQSAESVPMLQVMSRRVVRLEARLQTYKADMDQIQQLKVGCTACQLGFTAALSGPSAWPSHCCCASCAVLLLFLAVSLLHFIWYERARQQDNTSLAAVQLRSEDLKVFVESLLGLCSQDQRQLAEVRQSEDSLRRELRASQVQLAGHPLQASLQSQSALTVRSVGLPIMLDTFRFSRRSCIAAKEVTWLQTGKQAPSHDQTASPLPF